MIDYDESSDLDGLAHRLGIYCLVVSRLIQPQSCCSSKEGTHSSCSRLKAWKEGYFAKQFLYVDWVGIRDTTDGLPERLGRDC